MKRKFLYLMTPLLLITIFLPCTSHAAKSTPEPELKKEGHRVLGATVTEIKGDSVFYKTDEGTVRNFSLKEMEKSEKTGKINVGDQLTIEFDEGNQVVRIDRADELKTAPDLSITEAVAGKVIKFNPSNRILTIQRADGTIGTFKAKEAAALKLAAVQPGTTISLEIDRKNNLVEDFEEE